MIFKIGNPGCECCDVCACYPLDKNGHDIASGKDLTPTNDSYTSGKLGTSANFEGSSQYHRDHHACFSPAANTTWRVWFWFRLNTVPTYNATSGYQGVITKGQLNYVSGSPPVSSFDGEWGVFWRTPTAAYTGDGNDSSPALVFVYRSSSTTLAVHHTTAIQLNAWYFFHWTLNKNDNDGEVYGKRSTDNGDAGTTDAFIGTMSESDFPLKIGVNTGTNGEVLGANSGSFSIDNVGFSTTTKSAVNLYNSGNGKRCPYAG